MKKKSNISLFAGKANFRDEPLWYRLIVIVLIATFWITVFAMLPDKISPWLAISGLSASSIIGIIKGRVNSK